MKNESSNENTVESAIESLMKNSAKAEVEPEVVAEAEPEAEVVAEAEVKSEAEDESETKENIRKKEEEMAKEREHLKHGLLSYFKNLFDLRGDMMTHAQIDAMMHENTVIHGSNMWILMLAMIIACVGLFNNSPATINHRRHAYLAPYERNYHHGLFPWRARPFHARKGVQAICHTGGHKPCRGNLLFLYCAP